MALLIRKRIEDYIIEKYKTLNHILVRPDSISDDLEVSDYFIMHILTQMSREGLLNMKIEISDEDMLSSYTADGFSNEGLGISEPFDFEPKIYITYFEISDEWKNQIEELC